MRSAIKFALCTVTCLFGLSWPASSHADEVLPAIVQTQSHAILKPVGTGTYRKFAFTIYYATLWAPDGQWSAAKPYALQLRYARSLSKDTLDDTVMDDIRDQKVADEPTFARWSATIEKALPAVEDGDVLIGLSVPGKKSILYFNGAPIATIDDAALSRAFFNIWLGAGADEDLRNALLNKGE